MPSPLVAASYLWSAWIFSWLAAAVWSGRTVSRESVGDRLGYGLWLWVGLFLIFVQARRMPSWLFTPIVPPWAWLAWAGVGLAGAGVAYAWWARLHLGRLWSGAVTLKDGHRVVRTGPYALTRHPIYTGLLLALAATVLVRGDLAGVLGLPFVLMGARAKVALEERLLMRHFADDYARYRREVPALVPRFW
ncbi:MAG: isoprenylcysteine carboxylmethyltransferase family protein [Vicinamibacterales bacterium]